MLQNFYAYDLLPVWIVRPAIFSELPVPVSLSKASYGEVLLALLLETYHRGWVLAQCPSQESHSPAAKAQGGVFPPGFWMFSSPFSVCKISSFFFSSKKNTVTLL